ncbi:unnamed protein product [Rotaria magnacalcarata]|uniref:Uncharacterized protein n=2 Tax=Rotaria magnacalcarata TaxID=392030 RepID=A0A820LMF6_9BILA|nr:unnamed protein product [Rotaria magnacalcarata]CAF3882870.1 unnamed protein product [Rotaria magnacalcarata]CAF4359541.1 unnamed protein product [Rotaria magnacalcarata]
MHQLYHDTFKDTPAMYTKLIVGNRIRRQAHNELIRKRPNKALLKNTTITKKKLEKPKPNVQQTTTITEPVSTEY